jgi:hypothetical protein
MGNARPAENFQIVGAGVPVDLTTAGLQGDYVSMKNWGHLTVVCFSAIGTAGQDLTITLDQAKTVAAGSAKALNIAEVFHKVGATALSAVSLFTRVTQTAADGYDTVAIDGAENEMLLLLEVSKDDLDTDNDFDCVRAVINDDIGSTELGCLLYILSDPRFDAADAISD